MFIIGCDFHTRFQQIAMMESASGEIIERRLQHEDGEARTFYAALPAPVRVGMEATGHAQWFELMLAEQGHELWVGDAAQIRAGIVRRQKTDPRDAFQILKMLLEDRFPHFPGCGFVPANPRRLSGSPLPTDWRSLGGPRTRRSSPQALRGERL